ncbi:MAG: hypothetical protein ACLRVU_00870 [Beduini sp.]|uniref:hypothetical protein n=1 Tax=Beduini sp. TaxID=1922300 RepID=UPI0039A39520
MWIDTDDLKLLNIVFEPENLIPRNRKGNYKLRHISFFSTNMKAITNVCKKLEEIIMHGTPNHQFTEVLRKMGLINNKLEITKYGVMLLQIMYFDNNRIINEIHKATAIDDLPEDIPFIVEFFLFCVVQKCLSNKEECEKAGIVYDDLASEIIDNLNYFFSNIIDTLKEPTNKNSNVNNLFDFSNNDFYYTLQGFNFSGFEIKRLFRLSPVDMEKAWKAYFKVLSTYDKQNRSLLSSDEQRYYDYAKYYDAVVQKDVRNRVKFSIFNYILLSSIKGQRKKIKIVKNADYDCIMPYTFIEEKYEEYKLRDVYNLVFYENDSKYITKIIKPLKVGSSAITSITSTGIFNIPEVVLRSQNINIWDEIIFTDDKFTDIYLPNIYKVCDIEKMGANLNVRVELKNVINMNKSQEILDKLKEE